VGRFQNVIQTRFFLLTVAANLILNIPGVRVDYAVLVSLFYLFPDFALRQTLFAFADQKRFDNMLTGIPIDYTKFYVSMMVTIVILGVVLLYVCENIYVRDRCNSCWHNLKTSLCSLPCKKVAKRIDGDEVDGPSSSKSYKGDDEVDRERTLVRTLTANRQVQDEGNYSVVVHKLEKKYFDFPAVCGIDFAVQKGDCFGLLGMNGAGKTTTFNMMTLCETITDGTIEVNNVNCRNDKLEYKSQFGYCPQVDALNPLMTAYEILKYFAWIRGVPRHLLPNTVDYWLRRVDIDEFRDRQVQYFSGGTKRKLNTAVAMVGFPPLIFLDEPTTGVDPKSRRFVWGCIKEFQHQHKTVVLTSHSMDECEHLCNRLAIMAQGHFTCIGGIQQLKNKYGKGFTLTIKLKAVDGDNVGEFERLKLAVAERFVSSLKDEHGVSVIALNTMGILQVICSFKY
jgi:ATP-binding cassette, subfamily A (ABC1), member 3